MENWGSEKKNSLSWHIRKGAVSGLSPSPLTSLRWGSVRPIGSGPAEAGAGGEARETFSSALLSKSKKPGQTGEGGRVVKHNGSPVSRWSRDNWVVHGGGGRVRREQSGREIIDNGLWKPLPCKAMTQESWVNICPISPGPSQSRLLSWNN